MQMYHVPNRNTVVFLCVSSSRLVGKTWIPHVKYFGRQALGLRIHDEEWMEVTCYVMNGSWRLEDIFSVQPDQSFRFFGLCEGTCLSNTCQVERIFMPVCRDKWGSPSGWAASTKNQFACRCCPCVLFYGKVAQIQKQPGFRVQPDCIVISTTFMSSQRWGNLKRKLSPSRLQRSSSSRRHGSNDPWQVRCLYLGIMQICQKGNF